MSTVPTSWKYLFATKTYPTEAQVIGALRQIEAGRKAEDVALEVGVSKHTIYARNPRQRRRKRVALPATRGQTTGMR